MGNSRSAQRRLKKLNVYSAEKMERTRHELAMKMVAERVKTDAEFAAEVLKITGGILRPEIKKDAEETIAKSKSLLSITSPAVKTANEASDSLPNEIIDESKIGN